MGTRAELEYLAGRLCTRLGIRDPLLRVTADGWLEVTDPGAGGPNVLKVKPPAAGGGDPWAEERRRAELDEYVDDVADWRRDAERRAEALLAGLTGGAAPGTSGATPPRRIRHE